MADDVWPSGMHSGVENVSVHLWQTINDRCSFTEQVKQFMEFLKVGGRLKAQGLFLKIRFIFVCIQERLKYTYRV